MTVAAPFLRNAWYMAAWSHEIDEAPLRRRLLDEPAVLYRRLDGGVAMLVDRCPHRFAPLSLGTREGDSLVCPYHGLTFDAAGTCVRNPYSDTLPKGAAVRSFPVAERDGIAWFWAGEADRADAEAIPDFAMLFVPGHGVPIMGRMDMAAPYEMGTDNLLDLSHIEFVHKGSFAGNGVIFAGRHELREDGERLHSNWWMPDVAAPPHTFGLYDPAMRCDHWLDMRWDAPAAMYLEVGACPAGGDRTEAVLAHQAHILTPETTTSTHYFWATTRGHPPTDEGDAMLRGLMEQAFVDEDKPIIQATFDNMDGRDFWDLKPAFLGIDAGGTTARRKLARMIRDEQAGA